MHLVLNSQGLKWGGGKTLCGQPTETRTKGRSSTSSGRHGRSSSEIEIVTTMSIDEIVRAAAKDDKNDICNKCLAEFFDKVLPLKWQMKKKEAEAAAGAAE